MTQADDTATRTAGAVKAGNGRYFFDVASLDGLRAGEGYAETFGPVVEGELTQVGVMTLPAGSTAAPHHHPNEQWIYIMAGEVVVTVAGEQRRGGPGTLVYVPPNVVHSTTVVSREDARFFTTKDLRAGIVGTPADAT